MEIKLIRCIKKPSGFWHVDYECNGRITRQTTKRKVKSEAIKWFYNELMPKFKMLDSMHVQSIAIDIESAVLRYLDKRKKELQTSTLRSEKSRVLIFSDYIQKIHHYVNEITVNSIDRFFSALQCGPRTKNYYVCVISQLFVWFEKQGYAKKNPIITKKYREKPKHHSIEIPKKHEIKQIIDYIESTEKYQPYKIALLLPFYTGMRMSEVRGLNRKNIDISGKKINVVEKKTFEKSPVRSMKSKTCSRIVPIIDSFEIKLHEFLLSNEREYPFEKIAYAHISRKYLKMSEKLGIKFTYHMARHYFCSVLIDAGVNIKKIQTIMGHSTINITLDIYGHLIKHWDSDEFKDITI
jgi:integrase